MRSINHGKAPLAAERRTDFINVDLRYRITHLADAISRVPAQSLASCQAFEAGAVAGRVLLDFLGIGYDRRTGGLKESKHGPTGQTDDVKVVDLGGQYVAIASLSAPHQDTLAKFIHGVHKACAHLTIDSKHALTTEIFKDAGEIILRLCESHIPKT